MTQSRLNLEEVDDNWKGKLVAHKCVRCGRIYSSLPPIHGCYDCNGKLFDLIKANKV